MMRPFLWINLFIFLFVFGGVVISHAQEEIVAPSEPVALPSLENLDFVSGEVVAFDSSKGQLDVKVYLDSAGNAKEQVISLAVSLESEITDGENELRSDALVKGAEVDVEYDIRSNQATYIFVY